MGVVGGVWLTCFVVGAGHQRLVRRAVAAAVQRAADRSQQTRDRADDGRGAHDVRRWPETVKNERNKNEGEEKMYRKQRLDRWH